MSCFLDEKLDTLIARAQIGNDGKTHDIIGLATFQPTAADTRARSRQLGAAAGEAGRRRLKAETRESLREAVTFPRKRI